jgi:hypothetical protein
MILNGKNQLGLAFDGYMQDEVFNMHYQKYLANEPDLEIKIGATRQVEDLFSDANNNNYVFRQTAIDMASRIKLDKGKFEDLSFIAEKLPVKKCTYLMGKGKFYRWFRWDETGDIMVICIKLTPVDESVQGEVDKTMQILSGMSDKEVKDLINRKKAEGKLTPYEYGAAMAAINNKDLKQHASNGIFYYLWGIKKTDDGYRLNFPPDERNEDFDNDMMEFVRLLIFTELTDVETVHLGPNQSSGTKKQGKYLNNSNKNIRVIDSSWNKILIKGQTFSVSGHIRLQPYGPGMKYRKPIFIDEYDKDGYTRNALKEV